MPRQSIEELGPPPAGYRVDLQPDQLFGLVKFEHESSARDEDAHRIRGLEAAIKSGVLNRRERRSAVKLIKHLRRGLRGNLQRMSAASRLMMRDWRIRVGGWLWSLADNLGQDKWVFFTLVLPTWWRSSELLHEQRAQPLMRAFRSALYRAGAADASGWLYAMIHAEFDAGTDGFPLHIHGIATEGMIDVLRGLRLQRQFKCNKIDQHRYPQIGIRRKLVIQKPRYDHAALATYVNKSYWPRHDSRIDKDGVRRRFGRKRRIAAPEHLTRHLTWLHRERVKDQVLLVHLAVVDQKLVPTKRGDCKG